MKTYARYKDSGISWIGNVPEHWETKRLKYVVDDFCKGNGITKEDVFLDGNVKCVRYGEIYSKYDISFSDCYSLTKKEFITSPQYFSYGDILFAGTGELVEEIGKNIVYLGNEKCLAGGDIIIAKHSQNPSFLNYALESKYCRYQKSYGKAKLKVVHISAGEIGNVIILLPPLSEQKAIAEYLDKKTAQINELVSAKQKQIELLKEYKQSVIADAVTGKLNKNCRMKDSGYSWIGEIPENWESSTLRRLLKFVSDKGHPKEQLLSVTREQGVIIRNVESKEENHNVIPEDLSDYKLVKKGQFAINKMKSWQGSYGVSSFTGIVSPAYYVCDLDFENKDFFSIAIRSKAYIPFFTMYSKGIRVDQWDLSPIGLKTIPFFIPPEEEQNKIVSLVKDKMEKIDSQIVSIENQIANLNEYKQSLISDVVTGKVKVC